MTARLKITDCPAAEMTAGEADGREVPTGSLALTPPPYQLCPYPHLEGGG